MHQGDPWTISFYLLSAFVLAGILQTAWFKSRLSRSWQIPLDGGRCWRGRRILGDNKTLSGFVVMVPAAGVSFAALAAVWQQFDGSQPTPWDLSAISYLLLGLWAGFGFMVGELPNSFLKRQLDIRPGQPAVGLWQHFFFVVDQVDSIVAGLLAVALVVPVPLTTWLVVILSGGIVHWLFNVTLMMVGLKSRAA